MADAGNDMEESCKEEDVGNFLKTCPVKMKSITSFFQNSQTKKNKDSKIEALSLLSESTMNGINNNDTEISYEDFVKEKQNVNEKSVHQDENLKPKVCTESKTEEVSYEDYLGNCSKSNKLQKVSENSNVSIPQNSVDDENMEVSDNSKEKTFKTLCQVNGSKTESNEVHTEDERDIASPKNDNCKALNNATSDILQSKPVTGKGSIMNFFKKSSSKPENLKGSTSPDVVITKVEALIHFEPVKKVQNIPGKTFSIFDANNRKSGLEAVKGPKSNVSVSSTDIDMTITIIESIVTESNNKEENSVEEKDVEMQEKAVEKTIEKPVEKPTKKTEKAIAKTKEKEERKKAAVSRMASLDKIKVASKGKNAQSTLSFGQKGVALGKPVKGKYQPQKEENAKSPLNAKKKKRRQSNASQSDEFTPNSKKSEEPIKVVKRIIKFCGDCPPCRIEEDCAECTYCLDKPKFGGPGTQKQKCKRRKCEKFATPTARKKISKIIEKNSGKKVQKAKELVQKARAKKSTKSPTSPLKVSPKKSKKVVSVKKVLSPVKKTPVKKILSVKRKAAAIQNDSESRSRSGKNEYVTSPKGSNDNPMSPPSVTPKVGRRTRRNFSADSFDSTGSEGGKQNCGECKNCKTTADCGKCTHCKDKIKFGGPNKLRQKCKLRRCENRLTPNKPPKSPWAYQLLQRARTPKSAGSPKKKSPSKSSSAVGRKRGRVESETDSEPKTPSQNKKKAGRRQTTPAEEISDGENEESGKRRSSRRSAQAANKAIIHVVEDEDYTSEVSSLEATPKRGRKKKADTPAKTPRRKKGTKLAPIFQKGAVKKEDSDSDVEIIMTEEDQEKLKIRRAFLMSGVPDAVRKQQQTNVAVQLSDYPPFPRVSHVQQIDEEEPLWAMLGPDMDFKEIDEAICFPEKQKFSLCDKTMKKYDLTKLKNFKEHPSIKEEVTKVLMAEINTTNPSYPVKRTFRQLLKRKKETEKAIVIESKESKSDIAPANCEPSIQNTKKRKLDKEVARDIPPRQKRKRRKDSESVIVVDIDGDDEDEEPEEDRRKSTGKKLSLKRSSRRKSELEEHCEEKAEQKSLKPDGDIINESCPLTCCKRELLWTDKYGPITSKEIVGNSRNIEKLKTWLQDWKKVTDLEMKRLQKELEKKEKKSKKQLQKETKKEKKASEWSDESDFEMDTDDDSGSDYLPESDLEIGLCNTMLITGPHGIGKTASVHALAQELGYKVFEVNASSKRGGRQVLTQLQEATQSHQVSNKSLEDVFSTILSGASLKPKEEQKPEKKQEKKALPTAFTNLLNKCNQNSNKEKTSKNTTTTTPVKGRGRKAAVQNREEKSTPEKKPSRRSKRKSSDDVVFVKEEKTPVKQNSKTKPKGSCTDGKLKGPWGSLMNQKTSLEREESQDSESSTTKKGLDLSSCSLILFEEVDLVFEEDKGFWAAIQTFMNTTKRPILLTTRDPNFFKKFDPKCEMRMECVNMRSSSLVNITTYLQLICLTENVRTSFEDIFPVVEMLHGNIRQSLLTLQLWVESGSSNCPLKQPVVYNKCLLNKKVEATEDEGSQDGQTGSIVKNNLQSRPFLVDENAQMLTAAKSASTADSEDEFEPNRHRPRNNRSRKPIIEDDSSMDSIMGTPRKVLPPGMLCSLAGIMEEDSQHSSQATLSEDGILLASSQGHRNQKLQSCPWNEEYPLMHRDCFESLMHLSRSSLTGENVEDKIPGFLREIFLCKKGCEASLKTFFNESIDILQLNLIDLLPLPRKVTPLHSYTKFCNLPQESIAPKRKRIKNVDDLFDSEGDSDRESGIRKQPDKQVNGEEEVKSQTVVKLVEKVNNTAGCKTSSKIITSSLDTLSELYDEFSFSDCYLRASAQLSDRNSSTCSSITRLKFNLNYGASSLSPGQMDDAVVSVGHDDDNNWLKTEYTNEIRAIVDFGSYKVCKGQLENIVGRVSQLDNDTRNEVDELLTVPVQSLHTCLKCSELNSVQSSLQGAYRNAAKNLYLELNPKLKKDTRSEGGSISNCSVHPSTVALEYMPVLRSICKAEKLKEESKTKRRFLHYLESQHISLKKSTLDTLCTTFT